MTRTSGRIILASGGTAGHLYPAIAVAEELRARGEIPLFILPESEYREMISDAGFESLPLPAGPWQLQRASGRLRSVTRTLASAVRGSFVLRRVDAGVVMGFGSYGSIAPVLSAWACSIPSAILEPNAVAGLANRRIHRFTERVYVGPFTRFPVVPSSKQLRVGMPVRRAIEQIERREPGSHASTVLVLGDSHRSSFVDEHLPSILGRIAQTLGISMVHVTREDAISVVRQRYGECAVTVRGPVARIEELYAMASFVVSRAGASTVGELSALSMPSLLIPLAQSSEAHQEANAEVVRKAGAAIVRSERTWNPAEVEQALLGLLSSEAELRSMGEAASKLGFRGGASTIAGDLLRLRSRVLHEQGSSG